MGSIQDLSSLFIATIRSLVSTGSTAVGTGSGAANGVFEAALGSVSGIVNNG